MSFGPVIDQLLEALCCLPGVGPKSAQRMALHLLERDRLGGKKLAQSLQQAMEQVGHCRHCRTLTELDVCNICANQLRDSQQLCIVETPADVLAVEHAGSYRGLYFVLLGRLSPIDGIGPEDLGIPQLVERISESDINEIIIATNSTVEGEATAHYIAEKVKQFSVQVSRIAYGVPIGGELEYVDGTTLAHAFAGRKVMAVE